VVIALSQFASNPGWTHWKSIQHIIRYIKTTQNYGLLYKHVSPNLQIEAFSNASHNSTDDGCSILGYALSINNCCWLWRSVLAKTIAQSPQHAEIMAGVECLNDLTWTSHLCDHMCTEIPKPISFHMDSQSSIHMMVNPRTTRRSRYIDPKYFNL